MKQFDKLMLNKLFFVFIGGGIGSGLRYVINVYTLQTNYPQSGTLFVNILGSFLFGIFFVFFQNKTPIINVFLLTGVLGGFTTFSQFSFDVVQLQSASNLNSIVYIVFSLFLSIFALFIGIYLGNKIIN